MWENIKNFFSGSEVIFFARLQILIGIVAQLFTYVPVELWQPVLPENWFGTFLLVNGLATEYLRRRRADLGNKKTKKTQEQEELNKLEPF